jgi:hypothetical protein
MKYTIQILTNLSNRALKLLNHTSSPEFIPESYSLEPQHIVVESEGVNYTELGIFISGLILSLGGCFAIVSSHIRRSNCSEIDCFCLKCYREDMGISDE